MRRVRVDLASLATFENLYWAWRDAARGKTTRPAVVEFGYDLETNLLGLERGILAGDYVPGPYDSFTVYEPKRRIVSRAPFRDRVVHHFVCGPLAPELNKRMIHDTYANRWGKGTHRAIRRAQEFSRAHPFHMKLDVVKFFPPIDHELLLAALGAVFRPGAFFDLVARIVAGQTASGIASRTRSRRRARMRPRRRLVGGDSPSGT